MKLLAALLLTTLLCLGGTQESQAAGGPNVVKGHLDLYAHGQRMKDILNNGLTAADLPSLYYSILGLNYLQQPVNNNQAVCQSFKNIIAEPLNVEKAFYATFAQKTLKCSPELAPESPKVALKALEASDSSISDIYFAVNLLKTLGRKDYEKAAFIKNLPNLIKKNDSPLNLGYLFDICSNVNCDSWILRQVEIALSEMDEIDGVMLQWEGGLPTTAVVLSGILSLPTHIRSIVTPEQSVKLANYLLSRVSVQTVKGVALLLQASNLLAKNPDLSPICMSMYGAGYVATGSDPISVIVSDLVGKPHSKITADSVVAQSAIRLQDDVVVLSKQKFTRHQTEHTRFILDLLKVKPDRGLYKIAISVGSSSASMTVRVLGDVAVDNIEFGVSDVDGVAAPKMNSVAYPKKHANVLEADSQQKVIVKFGVKEIGQTKFSKVHQPFVRLSNTESNIEVIFVAEPDSSKLYRMDLDVGSVAENFKYKSGSYLVELIIGDHAISNPIQWVLGEVNLKFAQKPIIESAENLNRSMKKEIIHMFREPDARPPRIVSDVFTCLCIAPLLLLFILWIKIGVNIKNFSFSLSAIGFHLGFGAILSLFFIFWLKLNMFETIRYLVLIGFVTFICGHSLLVDVAKRRKKGN